MKRFGAPLQSALFVLQWKKSKWQGKTVDKNKKKTYPKQQSNCESCEYYDYDEYYQIYICHQNLDEDESVRFLSGEYRSCPYYKFYDEYKSVQKQN